MKLPSLNSLVQSAWHTLKRFPVTILLAIAGSVLLIKIVSLPYEERDNFEYLWNIVMACYLGMLLFIAISIYQERKIFNFKQVLLINLGGLILIAAYYFSLPASITSIASLRLVLFALALHLLISFVPYLLRNEINGFWQYNKILFLRFLTSALYTIVLYLGLILAVFAIDNLFKVSFDGNIYAYIWIVLAGIFNTWFFLAGIPKNFAALETKHEYPKGLKIFTQYVLLPLTTIYLVILYAYGMKIISDGEWPQGWVSYLVLGFSIGGILSLLLIYPIRNNEENKWVLFFSKIFYVALFPLIIMLYFAIKRRINEYGITEARYFVLILAVWLLLIALYFVFSKQKNIKLIPISLCVFALISTYGPFSAFSRSLASQQNRLTKVLSKNQLLNNNKVIPVTDTIPFADRKQISSITEYIIGVHGIQELQPFFSQNLDSLISVKKVGNRWSDYDKSNAVLSIVNLKYVSNYENEAHAIAEFYRNIVAERESARDIKEYDYFFYLGNDFGTLYAADSCKSFTIGAQKIEVCFQKNKNELLIFPKDKKDSALVMKIEKLLQTTDISQSDFKKYNAENLSIKAGNTLMEAKVYFNEINFGVESPKFKNISFDADLMIKIK